MLQKCKFSQLALLINCHLQTISTSGKYVAARQWSQPISLKCEAAWCSITLGGDVDLHVNHAQLNVLWICLSWGDWFTGNIQILHLNSLFMTNMLQISPAPMKPIILRYLTAFNQEKETLFDWLCLLIVMLMRGIGAQDRRGRGGVTAGSSVVMSTVSQYFHSEMCQTRGLPKCCFCQCFRLHHTQ